MGFILYYLFSGMIISILEVFQYDMIYTANFNIIPPILYIIMVF